MAQDCSDSTYLLCAIDSEKWLAAAIRNRGKLKYLKPGLIPIKVWRNITKRGEGVKPIFSGHRTEEPIGAYVR